MYDYVAGKQDWFAFGLPMEGEDARQPRAGDRAIRDVPTCALTERIGAVRERTRATEWEACVVVNEHRIVLGLLERRALAGDPDASVQDVMESGPSTTRPHAPLDDLRDYFHKYEVSVAVISTSFGELIGLVRRADV